jgi:hypothetical protein
MIFLNEIRAAMRLCCYLVVVGRGVGHMPDPDSVAALVLVRHGEGEVLARVWVLGRDPASCQSVFEVDQRALKILHQRRSTRLIVTFRDYIPDHDGGLVEHLATNTNLNCP